MLKQWPLVSTKTIIAWTECLYITLTNILWLLTLTSETGVCVSLGIASKFRWWSRSVFPFSAAWLDKRWGEHSSVTARLSPNHRVSVCSTLCALILFLHPVPLAQLPTLYISKMLTHPLCTSTLHNTHALHMHTRQYVHTFICTYTQTGPEEPVRLLRFWPDQYLKLQQYF